MNSGVAGFTGSGITLPEGDIEVPKGKVIESVEDFKRPIVVEAEMKSIKHSECISMSLFGSSSDKNSDISVEIGAWRTKYKFVPGNKVGPMGFVLDWRKVKLELNQFNNVKFYIDDELKYETTSSKTEGKLRFFAGCEKMNIRNIKIGKKIYY